MFKFIACSDLHIRKKTPRARKDLFYSSIRRKLAWLFNLAQSHDAYIICGGDVFDSVSVPHSVIEDVVKLAIRYEVKLLTVFGQHDLRYHVYKSHDNTPLAILLTSISLEHLDKEPFINEQVAVQGASWERSIPDILPGKVNILATHRMVTEGGPLWANHTNYSTAPGLLNTTKYDIIVSGDNHQSFIHNEGNRYVINSGSFLRLTTTQIQYQPRVVLCTIHDDNSIEVEWIDVPIRPYEVVFKEEEIEEGNTRSDAVKEQLSSFTNQLSEYKVDKPDYMYNLLMYKSTVVDNEVNIALENILSKVIAK